MLSLASAFVLCYRPRQCCWCGVRLHSRCFDMEHPAFVRQLSQADIIINPSYDWPGLNPYHAHIAAFRAIETGASVVHHCMVGASLRHDRLAGVSPKFQEFELRSFCAVSAVTGTSIAVDYRGVVLAHNDHFPMAAQRCAQSTITAGVAPGGGSACDQKEKALAGLYMSANVPTVGVTTLYAAVFGDVLPLSCIVLVLLSMVKSWGL